MEEYLGNIPPTTYTVSQSNGETPTPIPTVPSPPTTARDSNTPDSTGSTGGAVGSGSNTTPPAFRSEASTGDTSYTSSGSSTPGNTSPMSRIIAGLQNPNVVSGQGYNSGKYASARKNPLNQYVSFNCLYTLACLTPQQQKDGKFSAGSLRNIVCRTQGDWQKDNHVKTDFGSYDYIIDDLIITSIPSLSKSAGSAFATKITFKVTEPYSLGLFLIALQAGANAGGYQNFKEASFLLMIEFAGYREDKKPFIDNSITRYMPIKFLNIKLKAGQAGSIYECEAIPYNEVAFRDPYTSVLTATAMEGSGVKDVLVGGGKSLKKSLDEQAKNAVKDKIVDATDTYEIHFPDKFTTPSDTGNIISGSQIFTGFNDAGQIPFPDTPQYDTVRQIYKDRNINVKTAKTFNYKQNTKIQDIITDVILRSDYVIKQLLKENILSNPMGMIDWYRIETRIEDGVHSLSLGRQVRKMIFRVVPYKVSVSRFLPPNTPPSGYPAVNASVTRVYEYLYTGQNTDIINLNLEYNCAFLAQLPSDAGSNTGTNNSALTPDANARPKDKIAQGGAVEAQDSGPAAARTSDPSSLSTVPRGSGTDDDKSMQARSLEAILTNGGDLCNLEIEVRGDPYYLPSSGMGNQIIEEDNFNVLKDGSMNYQSGETDFVVVIRTPIDLDPVTGFYKFAKTVDELSGLFMITEVESKFNHNKFTQIIKGIRRRVQLGSGASGKNSLFG